MYSREAVAGGAGLIVRNAPAEIENDQNVGQHVDYVALPY